MLIINQALCVPGLHDPLLCTNQLRLNDIRVNDEPKHMVLNPTEYHHAVAIKTPDGNEHADELLIPLRLSGVFSYFEAQKPSKEEWEKAHEDWCISLTYDSPEWEPTNLGLEKAESAMIGDDGLIVQERDADYWSQERISRVIESLLKDRVFQHVFEPSATELAGALQSHVNIAAKGSRSVRSVKTGKKK